MGGGWLDNIIILVLFGFRNELIYKNLQGSKSSVTQ